MDFSFGFGLGSSAYLLSGYNPYNPLINYDWSTTTTSGLRYLKDVGSTPTYNASMYFGRGAYLNGVDQTITVPINATIQTALKRVNGVITISETSQVLTNYVISGLGVHKDYYLFTRLLTTAEKDSYTNTPEAFYAMAQADSTCVLNMPMCENDGFVRDYKSYSEGSNLVINGDFNSGLNNWIVSKADATHTIEVVEGKLNFNLDTTTVIAQVRQDVGLVQEKVYILEYEITKYTSGSLKIDILAGNTVLATTIGKHRHCFISASSTSINFYRNSANVIMSLDNISVKQLSGIYPITNYLATCRTNAQRLPYGLQTSGFKRDTAGLILSKSNFLETDGVGYSNTGWIPKWNEDFTVENIFEVSNDTEFRLNGNNYVNGVYFGKYSGGKKLYVRVFGSTVHQIANTKDIVCLTFSYNWQTKEVKQYVDGVLVTTQLATQTTNATTPVILGMVALGSENYPIIKPIRLLKVHQKALTQEEVTKNFNKYQAQGLLNE